VTIVILSSRSTSLQTTEREGEPYHRCRIHLGEPSVVRESCSIKLKYVYNWVGEFEQLDESTEVVPTGNCVLSAAFEKEGDAMPTEGTLSLYINADKVGEREEVKTQPGKFSIAGDGLYALQGQSRACHRRLPRRLAVGARRRHDPHGHRLCGGRAVVALEKEVVAAFARDGRVRARRTTVRSASGCFHPWSDAGGLAGEIFFADLLPHDVVHVLVNPHPHAELKAVGEAFLAGHRAPGDLFAAVLADREYVDHAAPRLTRWRQLPKNPEVSDVPLIIVFCIDLDPPLP
jgi:hypothetical protein